MEMKKQLSVLLFCLLFVTSVSFAHGEMQHVMGTIKKISKDSITIKTKTDTVVTVAVTAETMVMKGEAAAKIADLKVGDRVVIEAKKDEKDPTKLVAHMIMIGQMGGMSHQDQHSPHN